ncbi:MAG: DUF1064 domain-containing protein [Planctomycetaceae bacterium]|nr:DUF1064 domain-containing protein [Planctomycetaceae bacterium]
MSKYRNKITYVDGIRFASKREANRYSELKLLELAGEITHLELQPRYELQPAFDYNGKWIRSINYVADFRYYDLRISGEVVEDTKGHETQIFKLKRKLLMYNYDIDVQLT